MNNIIIYGSKYGTTEQYAKELSKRLNIEAIEYENVNNINDYDTIIYLGGLYAGGVLGMSKTLKKLNDISNKRIFIITVGLADPNDELNINHIKNGMKKQLSNELYDNAHIYHLRGGINYSKLNAKHKIMMKLVYNKAKKLPEEEKTPEVKAMIETYNKEVYFMDYSTLDSIINDINN